MKWSFANVGIIIFGLIGIFAIVFFTELTISNEQDYYSLKDAAEAAMIESIDIAYYRLTGSIKMSQEKFVENFTRRFTRTSTYGQGNYSIQFFDISETPPKVSIRIVDATNEYNIFNTLSTELDATQIDIINELSGILDVYSDGDNSMTMTPASLRQHIKEFEEKEDDDLSTDASDPIIKPQIWGINFIDGELIVTTDDGEQYVYEDDEEPEIEDCYQYYDTIECNTANSDYPIVLIKKKTDNLPFKPDSDPDPNPDPVPNPNPDPDSKYTIKAKIIRVSIDAGSPSPWVSCGFLGWGMCDAIFIPKYKYLIIYNDNLYAFEGDLGIFSWINSKESDVLCYNSNDELHCVFNSDSIPVYGPYYELAFKKLSNIKSLNCVKLHYDGKESKYYLLNSSYFKSGFDNRVSPSYYLIFKYGNWAPYPVVFSGNYDIGRNKLEASRNCRNVAYGRLVETCSVTDLVVGNVNTEICG